MPHLSAFPHTRLDSHKMNHSHSIWCLSWTANWSSPESKEIVCHWGTWRFTTSIHTSLYLDSILSQMHRDHPMSLRSKLLLSPTYSLVSQLPSSLQIFTPRFPQLSHAFYTSCLCQPHSFDHAHQSPFLHQNIAFGTFYRYCNNIDITFKLWFSAKTLSFPLKFPSGSYIKLQILPYCIKFCN